METLFINETYFLNTRNNIVSNKRIGVVGIMNFADASRRFPLNNVALNYKISPNVNPRPGEDPYELYFKDKLFYNCTPLNAKGDFTTGDEFVVWDDIISWETTRALKRTRNYKLIVHLNSCLSTTVVSPFSQEEFIEEMKRFAVNLGTELEFKPMDDDYTTNEEVFEARVEKVEDIIKSVEGLAVVTPVLDRLNSNDINGKLEQMRASLDIIQEGLTVIRAGMRA